ncbi:histidine protein methyltransferase 1 homolog isoform X2 [Prorops nasuta]|uniref:histidine protein methyltransferase 1 homolog isoform X2 n=1 Tax=Prorops nasuta TaxID=863751 RepID=UPI0034CFF9AD
MCIELLVRKMFKFNFSDSKDEEEKTGNSKSKLNWLPALEIDVSSALIKRSHVINNYSVCTEFPGITLNYVSSKELLETLKLKNCYGIIEAESQHSDLVPAKYEGGLKIWECSYDLGKYIMEQCVPLENKLVLDLGCGAGIIGILALLKQAEVHFQDYNIEVIESFTVPNILLNVKDDVVKERCKFYSGDWEAFSQLYSNNSGRKYDIIFTSETIYNPDNHQKLYNVFKENLKKGGVAYIAGKIYYFGVGGCMRQFENLAKKDGIFKTDVVWKCEEGLLREILRLIRI